MTDYFARASDFKVKHRRGKHRSAITALKFSHNQEFLGSCDDDGQVIIYETEGYSVVRNLHAAAPVRDFEWHPYVPCALVVGCTNGDLIKITMSRDGVSQDTYGLESVDGFIHMLTIDNDGNQVAIAYATSQGMLITIFTMDTFQGPWGHGRQVPIPQGDVNVMGGYPLVRDTLGFKFYDVSAWPSLMGRTIPLKPGTLIGGCAMSSSGEYLAVTNLIDGIDIYDVHSGGLVSTIEYPLGERYVVGVAFLNDDTVIAGHSRGTMVIASWNPYTAMAPVAVNVFNLSPVQTVAAAVIKGVLWVAGGSNPRYSEIAEVALLNQLQENADGIEDPQAAVKTPSKFWTPTKYGLASSLVLALLAPVLLSLQEVVTTEQALLFSTVVRTQVATVPGPISTITMTKTRIATIPGPMTTTTKLRVERLTETFTTTSPAPALTSTKSILEWVTETETVTVMMGAETSVPDCTTRTLFEMATQTVTTTVESIAAACTPVSCSQDKRLTGGAIFMYLFDLCGLTSLFLIAWSFGAAGLDPSHEVLHLVRGDADLPIGYDVTASDGIEVRGSGTDNVAQGAPVDELLHSEMGGEDDGGKAEHGVADRDSAADEDPDADEVVGDVGPSGTADDSDQSTSEEERVADDAGVFEDTETPIQEDREDSESKSDGSTEVVDVETTGDTAALEGGIRNEASSSEMVEPGEPLREGEESVEEEVPRPAQRGRGRGRGRGGKGSATGRKGSKK